MRTIRAVVVERFGAPETVEVREERAPSVGPGQVLVEVAAAAVNAVDLVTRQGVLHAAGLHSGPPLRLGWDVAGTVADVGPDVRRLRPGLSVLGLSARLDAASKTHADRVLLDEDAVAAVDDRLEPIRLSALPLAGLTAWQALDRAGVERGTSLLVTGAAGAVGSLVTQLALVRGATVLATGRDHHRPEIEALGATYVDAADPAAAVRGLLPRGVDAAIDTAVVGARSLDAVRDAGRHVSLVVSERPAPLRGVDSSSLAVRADWQQMTLLASLVASGALTLPAVESVPLADAASAYDRLERSSRPRLALVP